MQYPNIVPNYHPALSNLAKTQQAPHLQILLNEPFPPPYHTQKTSHILTEFDEKIGDNSNSRNGKGKYEPINLVRVSFVEGQKRGSAVIVDGFKFRYVNKRKLAENVVKYYRCKKKCGVFCHLFFDNNGCLVKAEKSCS